MADRLQEFGGRAVIGAGNPAGQAIKDYYGNYVDSVRDVARDVVRDGLCLMKFTLSEAGLYKTAWKSQKINGEMLDTKNNAPETAQIFACGDYFLPLSLRFSLSAEKRVAESQLVDGIAIYECINKASKVVTCTFEVERAEPNTSTLQTDAQNAVTHIMRAKPNSRNLLRTDVERTAMLSLTKFLGDLYENNDVFEVVNPVLNNELGINHAFLRRYSITPQVGSTFFQVSMTLQEVNVNDSIIWATDEDSGEIPAIDHLA